MHLPKTILYQSLSTAAWAANATYIIEAFDKQLRAILTVAVAQDDSLSVFVNSYLRFHKRAYDAEELATPAADVGVSGAERALLQRRVFMVLYRM